MPIPFDENDDIIWDDQVYQKVWDGLKAKRQNNLDLAEKLFQDAIKQGSTEALGELGVLYVEQGNTTLANRALKLAIKAGELGALQKLAGLRWQGSDKIAELVYEKGKELYSPENLNYRYWYKLAARLGSLRAATLLSLNVESVEEQKEWLNILIVDGDTTAMIELAEMLIDESNFEEAKTLLNKAQSLGSPYVDESLIRLERLRASRSPEYQKICSLFELGFESKNNGDLEQAELLWRQVILYEGYDQFDRVLEALDCLGVLVANQGRLQEAADFWSEAYRRSIAETFKQRYFKRLETLVGDASGSDLTEIKKKIHAVGLDF
jgi:TPR repeat protein